MSDAQRMRTKKEVLAAVVHELNLDVTDPFTRIIAAAFALQEMLEEARAALTRAQAQIHLMKERVETARPEAPPTEWRPMLTAPIDGTEMARDASYVRARLRAETVIAGSQRALAKKIGCSATFLNDILLGKREPVGKPLEYLRLRRRLIYESY